jgi:excisionase family DNA binding protein
MARKNAKSVRWMKDARLSNMPDVMTVEQAARLLGIGRNAAYEAARRDELPAIRIGRRLLVPRAALQQRLALAGQRYVDDAQERC